MAKKKTITIVRKHDGAVKEIDANNSVMLTAHLREGYKVLKEGSEPAKKEVAKAKPTPKEPAKKEVAKAKPTPKVVKIK